jgi:hypothetical protein
MYHELHGQNEAHRAQLQEAQTMITELQRLSRQQQKDDYSSCGRSWCYHLENYFK